MSDNGTQFQPTPKRLPPTTVQVVVWIVAGVVTLALATLAVLSLPLAQKTINSFIELT